MSQEPKQKLITAGNYKKFIGLLDEALQAGNYLVAGSLQQWEVEGEDEFPGVLVKYVAVVEEPWDGTAVAF
jgi:hypothetical protein